MSLDLGLNACSDGSRRGHLARFPRFVSFPVREIHGSVLETKAHGFFFNLSIVAIVLNIVRINFFFSFLESGHFPLATDKDSTDEMSGERDTSHWR